MDVKLYKVASFEVVDMPLLKVIGKTKKPVIMSRGMATVEEIKLAVETLKKNGCPQVAILHCISSYPAIPEQMNLKTIPDIKKKLGIISGLSDHTLSQEVAVAAAALGANIIEKHITISRADGGPDANFSLEPAEFKNLVKSIRMVESALGKPFYGLSGKESENVVFRRSLFAVEDIEKGEKLTEGNVRSIRPGHGLAPKFYDKIIGMRAGKKIERGTPLKMSLVEK